VYGLQLPSTAAQVSVTSLTRKSPVHSFAAKQA
jgi:hypothetical protein